MAEHALDLDGLVTRAGELYSLPRVAAEILELTSRPTVDPRQIKQCIERDPALAAKLLRVVNSSLFGLSRKVSDLNQALALLGTKPLKLLVLGFSLPDALFAGLAGDVLSRYWQHTLVRAVAAREIATLLGSAAGDEVFLAGLLRDLGMLVLLRELGLPYAQFLEQMHAEGADAAALEQQMFTFNRFDVTVRLLERWSLPGAIVQAASNLPGRSDTGGSDRLQQIVGLAEQIATLLADGRIAVQRAVIAASKQLGLVHSQLVALVTDLQAKVKGLAEVLSLDFPQGRDYREVLLEAQQKLAHVAGEAVVDMLSAGSNVRPKEESLLATAGGLLAGRASAAKPGSETGAAMRTEGQVHTLARRANTADPALHGWLGAAVARCRELRQPLALVLVELDRHPELIFTLGVERARRLQQELTQACERLAPGARVVAAADARLALVLANCDRSAAVRAANELLAEVRIWNAPVSIGIAAVNVPPRNFPPGELQEAADRCLFAAQSCGGNCLKSIEVA